jgi:hypothetical protein
MATAHSAGQKLGIERYKAANPPQPAAAR